MFFLGIGLISFLVGVALAIVGFLMEAVFDCGWSTADMFMKIGLAMMTIPFVVGLLFGAFILLLSLFGLAILF